MRTIIIIGSARKDGDTAMMVDKLIKLSDWDAVDLGELTFSQYDYEHQNKDDDFLPLMERVIRDYDTIVIATPVYFYMVSGLMKKFIDRFTDLLTIEKELGRKLREMNMAALSCSVGDNMGDSFWIPIRTTANYLGMNYLADLHTIVEGGKLLTEEEELMAFIKAVDQSSK